MNRLATAPPRAAPRRGPGLAAVLLGTSLAGGVLGATHADGVAAIYGGDPTELDALLRRSPALVHSREVNGETLLHRAASSLRAAMVAVLLRHGADPNATEQTGATPLHRAALLGASRTAGADPGPTLRALIAAGADPNARSERGVPPLHVAVSGRGQAIPVVRALLDGGADLRQVSASELEGVAHVAARKGTVETLEWLLAYGVEPNPRNRTEETPLHVVSEDTHGRIHEKARALITSGAAVGARDFLGRSPLHLLARLDVPYRCCLDDPELAARSQARLADQQRAVELLVRSGGDVNARDSSGSTPLLSSVAGENTATARSLIRLGATLEVRTRQGSTPLSLAVSKRSLDMARALLEVGANPDGPPHRDATPPLFTAIVRRDLEMVKLLVSAGADVNVKDPPFPFTPLQRAQRRGTPEIVSLLREAGAR